MGFPATDTTGNSGQEKRDTKAAHIEQGEAVVPHFNAFLETRRVRRGCIEGMAGNSQRQVLPHKRQAIPGEKFNPPQLFHGRGHIAQGSANLTEYARNTFAFALFPLKSGHIFRRVFFGGVHGPEYSRQNRYCANVKSILHKIGNSIGARCHHRNAK